HLLFVQLTQRVEQQVGVAVRLNGDGKGLRGALEVERAAGQGDDGAQGRVCRDRPALRADDAPFVEEDAGGRPRIVADGERAGEACVLDDLHGVEDADDREVAGEGGGARVRGAGRWRAAARCA